MTAEEIRKKAIMAQGEDRGSANKSGVNKFSFGDLTDVKFLSLTPNTKYVLDIIPFLVSGDGHPNWKQLVRNWGTEEGILDHFITYYQHRNIGVSDAKVICPKETYGKPCPICEEMEHLKNSGYEWNSKEVKDLRPSQRTLMNVVLKNEPNTIYLFDYSYFWFYANVKTRLDRTDDSELFWLGDLSADGRTLEFFPEESQFDKKMAGEIKQIDFLPKIREYDDSIIEQAYPLDTMLNVYSYDELQAIFNGEDVDTPEDVSVEPEPVQQTAPKRNPRRERIPPKKQETECPFGHTYGADNFATDDCSECDLQDACETRFYELNPDEV